MVLFPQARRLWRAVPRVIVVALLSGSNAWAQDVDVTPPELVDFTFSPTAIDVSAGSQIVEATVRATDDLSGAVGAVTQFRSPSSGQFVTSSSVISSGEPTDRTFTVHLVFPQFAEAGTWTVGSIQLWDVTGNNQVVSTAVLQSRGFPTELEVTSTPDVEAPQVSSIAISPSVIDVSASDDTVTIELGVTDDLSGASYTPCTASPFAFFAVTVRSPSGGQNRYISSRSMSFVSGTPLGGTWRGSFSMPRYSEPGTWLIQSLSLRDCAGNSRFYSTAMLDGLGLTTSFIVASDPADTDAPVLTSLSFTPITIDTASATQSVTVRLGIRDGRSGVSVTPTTPEISFFERGVSFRSPSGSQLHSAAFFSQFTLVSGTPFDGIWEATVVFPRFSEDGTWWIDLIQVKDATRNIRTYTRASLEALGMPVTLEVIRPSLDSDGIAGPGGGTIVDDTFGDRATVTFPSGVLTTPTDVAIDVFREPLDIPNPVGFTGPGTLFVNIDLQPPPAYPLPAPGLEIVLPLPDSMPSGTLLWLFRVDTATGHLVPAVDVFGHDISGIVQADGLTARFSGIARLSTVVGMIPDAISVAIDIKPKSVENRIDLRSTGGTPVAIFSTASFNAVSVRPETVRLAGASVRLRANGQRLADVIDVNGDGRLDLVLSIDTQALQLTSSDTEAVLVGETESGVNVIGRDAIRLVPE